jgi:hypothetical protein
MRMFAAKKWMFLALALTLTLVVAVPAQSQSLSWLLQWWRGSITEPIADVEFTEISTANARLAEITITRFRITGIERVSFDPVDLTALVEAELLTFGEIVLTEGTTTVTIVIDPATLRTDVLGSSFRTTATVTIVTEEGTTELEAQVRGRIATRNGVYYLSAAVLGTSVTNISRGSSVINLISLTLTGNVDEPIEEIPSTL